MSDTVKAGVISAIVDIVVTLAGVAYTSDKLQKQSLSGSTSNITGALAVSGNTTVGGTLGITGATTQSSLTVSGATALNGGITADSTAFTVADTSGNVATTGTLAVTGASTLTGAVAANGGISVDSTAFTVADTSGNVATTGTLAVTGASTFTGRATVSNLFGLTPSTLNITVTDGATITPVSSFQKITAAGAVGATIAAATAGTLVCLWNTGAQTITITDAGAIKLTADAVLTTDDTLCVLSDGTNWLEIGVANN